MSGRCYIFLECFSFFHFFFPRWCVVKWRCSVGCSVAARPKDRHCVQVVLDVEGLSNIVGGQLLYEGVLSGGMRKETWRWYRYAGSDTTTTLSWPIPPAITPHASSHPQPGPQQSLSHTHPCLLSLPFSLSLSFVNTCHPRSLTILAL